MNTDNAEIDKVAKGYIYTRVSTDMQLDGYSLEAQLEECTRFAEYKKIKVVRTYTDEGKSGKDVEGRPSFLQMMKDIETDRDGVSAVLVFKLSRFGRNATDVLPYVEFLKTHDVVLYSVKDNVDSATDMGKFFITVLTALAEMERVNILEQTQAGRNQKARLGKWNGGKPPIGYNLTSKEGTLTVNEEEAKIVKAIFYKYVNEKKSAYTISKEINALYKKPQRQKNDNPYFGEHNIRRILDDITYTGVIAYGKTYTVPRKKTKSGKPLRRKQTDESKIIYVPGSFEAIIDDKTWELAKNQRDTEKAKHKHNRKKSSDNHIYPLAGLIRCPDCGRFLDGRKNWGKVSRKTGIKGADTFDYGCKNHLNAQRGHEKCPFKRQLNEDKLCAELLKIIDAISVNEEFTKRVAEKINAAIDVTELENIKSSYEKELRASQFALDRVNAESDRLDPNEDTYEVAYDNCQKRRDNLVRTITELKKSIGDTISKINAAYENKMTLKNIYSILSNFSILYSKFDDEEKKRCLQVLIEEIEIQNYDKNQIDYSKVIKSVKFRFPLNINGEETYKVYLTNETDVETVVLLSQQKPKFTVDIEINLDEFDRTAAEAKATYQEIKDYVYDKYKLKVSHLNIAQIKQKYGIIERQNYNHPKSENSRQPNCTPEKEKAITDALKYFKMIN